VFPAYLTLTGTRYLIPESNFMRKPPPGMTHALANCYTLNPFPHLVVIPVTMLIRVFASCSGGYLKIRIAQGYFIRLRYEISPFEYCSELGSSEIMKAMEYLRRVWAVTSELRFIK